MLQKFRQKIKIGAKEWILEGKNLRQKSVIANVFRKNLSLDQNFDKGKILKGKCKCTFKNTSNMTKKEVYIKEVKGVCPKYIHF